MPEGKDYFAMVTRKPEDKVDYGVKGMKWGVRRSSAQLRAAAAKRGEGGESKTSTAKKTSGPETSQARYNRLRAQSREKGASSMSDEDLKWFNARTEALSKVARLNEQKPGWLSDTAKKVLQETARNSMAQVAAALADKHVTGPIVENIKKAPKKK